ncbi:uncharacterized protein ACA1_031130 [Acanthamoeba castellanii str. Neff]|uniref:Uncharacterized protein n=1 Tax=Acanthamoeba castellanii (strain ATCC 30010 / Neff) TaxID=1257118 RepID=L8GJ69_ACACF|nr:uncharacterized protein ACA1_031130 [Acanthamoeba castellanii str. Neff]ELR12231.1 hypothetical protein ACA1_031130 [Acanthamoeba castellanii str. Neff]
MCTGNPVTLNILGYHPYLYCRALRRYIDAKTKERQKILQEVTSTFERVIPMLPHHAKHHDQRVIHSVASH